MSKWSKVRLDECSRIVSGGTPSTSVAAYWDGSIPWATPKDLSDLDGPYLEDTPRKITKAGLQNSSAEILPANSVLFSSRAPIGHVAVNRVPTATNQGFKSFVPDPARLDSKYLYHWLRKHRLYLESMGNGATFKEVSKEVVSRVEIPLPPLPEQRRIAAILDHAEALRAKRRQAMVNLGTLISATLVETFGDPSLNNKGWPKSTLGSLCAAVIDCPHSTPSYASTRTPHPCVIPIPREGGVN
ncbi:MAG: restriction endonuclease subunit S [Dehalococcoidia bacterium]